MIVQVRMELIRLPSKAMKKINDMLSIKNLLVKLSRVKKVDTINSPTPINQEHGPFTEFVSKIGATCSFLGLLS